MSIAGTRVFEISEVICGDPEVVCAFGLEVLVVFVCTGW